MADADLLGLGLHCAVEHCKQIDFLPFKCDCCRQTYCLDHRTYAAHNCTQAAGKTTEVIVCPICAKGVRLAAGQDPNAAFEEHTRSAGCDPANYARVHKKARCPVGGCKEKLSTINTYHCRTCNQRVCLRHRHGDDHSCDAARAAAAAAAAAQRAQHSVMGKLQAAFRPASSAGTAAATAAAAASGRAGSGAVATVARPVAAPMSRPADPTNTLQGTAHRRMNMQHSSATGALSSAAAAATAARPQQASGTPQQNSQVHRNPAYAPPTVRLAAVSNANPLVPPHLPEECPQCGACFASVERLIQHVDDFHPSSAAGVRSAAAGRPASNQGSAATAASAAFSSMADRAGAGAAAGGGGGEVYRCPHCARQFNDAVQLVGHVERCAVSGGRAGTAAAGDSSSCNVQ